MKSLCKIILLVIILSVTAEAQPVTWQRYYDYNHQRNVGTDVVQTFDGGYVILGSTGGTASIYLIKIDYLGIKQWEKVISDSSTFIAAYSIVQTPDSGFAMTGSRGLDIFLLKTDNLGNPQWTKYFNRAGGDARAFQVYLVDDNSYMIGGLISFFPITSIKSYIVKTNSIGNLSWDLLLGDSIFASGARVVQTTEKEYFATNTNYRNNSGTNFNGLLYRLDDSGNIIWKKSIGINKSVEPIIFEFPDKIYLAGFDGPVSNYKFYLSKIDSSGNILWQYSYDSAFALTSICYNSNFDIIFAGDKSPDDFQWDFAVTKIDINGNFIYRKLIETPESSDDFCYSIKYTNDNGYIFVGTTDYASAVFKDDNILVVKTDSGFNTSSIVNISNNHIQLPSEYRLHQNYPNPFNPTTKVTYEIPKPAKVDILISDITGREIARYSQGNRLRGIYTLSIELINATSGVYFYSLLINDKVRITKKMVIAK